MAIKKGELTTQQLVTIIILIISFVVILFLIFRIGFGEETEKEICHNSVVLKAKTTSLGGSLDCRTSYVCISGGGKCENFDSSITKEISMSGTPADIKSNISKAIADEMADCWWMFGEGEIDYLGTDFKGTHCAICSVIKFDERIQEVKAYEFSITYDDLYGFLINNKKDQTQTYLQYLYNVGSLDKLPNKFSGEISTNERYSVITGLNPNWPDKDGIIFPTFMRSDEVGDETKSGCNVFDITKA
jgi:hypothetical protein